MTGAVRDSPSLGTNAWETAAGRTIAPQALTFVSTEARPPKASFLLAASHMMCLSRLSQSREDWEERTRSMARHLARVTSQTPAPPLGQGAPREAGGPAQLLDTGHRAPTVDEGACEEVDRGDLAGAIPLEQGSLPGVLSQETVPSRTGKQPAVSKRGGPGWRPREGVAVKEAVGADPKRSRADGVGERRRISSLLRRAGVMASETPAGWAAGGARRDRDSTPLPGPLQVGYRTRVGLY